MTEDELVDSITDSMGRSLRNSWEIMKDREGRHAAAHGIAKELDIVTEHTHTMHRRLPILQCIMKK